MGTPHRERRESVRRIGENSAAEHLRNLGYRILAQNWRSGSDELDVVAQDGGTLVFVEVRARTSERFGTPLESVTRAKMRRLQRAASAYQSRLVQEMSARFDIVEVVLEPDKPKQIRHHQSVWVRTREGGKFC